MTSTIFYKGKGYACEFVKNVSSEDIKGNLRIYASRHDRRVFLVTEFNEVLATETLASYQIDAILDEEDCNFFHHFYTENPKNKKNFDVFLCLRMYKNIHFEYNFNKSIKIIL